MAQTVCLDEKDHAVDILHNLQGMQLEDDLCDFTSVVKSGTIRAHKCILSAGSQYFKAMFKHNTKENEIGKVEMVGLDELCVKSCIKFIYSGKFDVPHGKTAELLHTAIMLELDKMKDGVCNILIKSLSCENFYSTREIAITYDLQSVLSSCATFYCLHFPTMSSIPEFISELKSHIVKVFNSKKVMSSEKEKLQAILRWAQGNIAKKNDLLELVNLVDLKAVPPEFLKDLLKNDPIISRDFHLYKLINAQLMETLSNLSRNTTDNEKLLLFDNNAYCLQAYNPTDCKVAKLQNSDFIFSLNFTAVHLGDFVYVLCDDKSVYRFNLKTGWVRMADMTSHHGVFPPSVALAGSLFVIGAGDGMSPCRSTEQFKPTINKWVKLKGRPKAITGAALVALGDSIYCIGGWRTTSLDQTTSFCQHLCGQLHYPRSYSSAVASNEKIFVVGGFRGMAVTSMMECYSVTMGQWAAVSSMPLPVPDVLARCVNFSVYIMARHRNFDEMLKYDITKDDWCCVKLKCKYSICDFVVV